MNDTPLDNHRVMFSMANTIHGDLSIIATNHASIKVLILMLLLYCYKVGNKQKYAKTVVGKKSACNFL